MEASTPNLSRALLHGALLVIVAAASLAAQDAGEAKLRQQQDELARIRREREALQQRMRGLQSKAHDISEEVDNLNRQHNATVRVVRSLDQQLTTLNGEVEHTTANLVRAQDEVQVKRAILSRRLVEIYKRGPLYTMEVMLSAKSFADLVARYKYLHILTQRDRAVLRRVDQLRTMIIGQRRQLGRVDRRLLGNAAAVPRRSAGQRAVVLRGRVPGFVRRDQERAAGAVEAELPVVIAFSASRAPVGTRRAAARSAAIRHRVSLGRLSSGSRRG